VRYAGPAVSSLWRSTWTVHERPFSPRNRRSGGAVTCVLAAQDLARTLPWFAASVRDTRMLRIQELNDLLPVVQQAAVP